MAATMPPELVLGGDDGPPSPLLNKPAPNFTLQNLNGKKVSLADYKGKAVLINFWATWCGPCKLETPWLVELRDQYASKGFEILGISSEADNLTDDDKDGWAKDKAAINKFVQQQHMQYPVLINGDSIAKDYGGLDAMPSSFYVDRSGIIVATQTGEFPLYCSEYCGTGHASMLGKIVVMEPGDYDRWAATGVADAQRPEAIGEKLFTQYGCIGCRGRVRRSGTRAH